MGNVVFPSAVNGHTTWVSISRRLKMFNDIDPLAQPALFVVQHRETYETRYAGVPPRRVLDLGLWCFAPSLGDVVGDEYLDSMFEGIEAVLDVADNVTGELTLGNLCHSCTIDRRDNMLIRDPGDIDGQALLIVPIRIVLP
jgi:hypothetical protein